MSCFGYPCLSPPPVSAARCRRKMDKMSKSDPFVVVKWKTDSDERWREIGERERERMARPRSLTSSASLVFVAAQRGTVFSSPFFPRGVRLKRGVHGSPAMEGASTRRRRCFPHVMESTRERIARTGGWCTSRDEACPGRPVCRLPFWNRLLFCAVTWAFTAYISSSCLCASCTVPTCLSHPSLLLSQVSRRWTSSVSASASLGRVLREQGQPYFARLLANKTSWLP